ncbi:MULTISPECIES: VOC family protein [Acidovorax]|uniref:VOC family protein n=1 Tax=Acidovorax TaxID=12916 RepID=UPI00023758BE|nr:MULTISPECIES: VOC family protein [Acidovorax]KRD22236.1 3-demethylubiquinone-9 3-methyltransferase [Acidovorax sp. Root267]KRD46118.1 3-demethylubiquinone-9 3-methyltransferase [Acidovorax sp. Root275]MBD9393083.1 VOC family protein [Acidovorax sp. ACV01]
MKVEPYLMFEGRCEEALDFYRRALGAEVTMLMRYKDNPEPAAGQGCAEGGGPGPTPEMVMHAAFNVGETQVMASDGMGSGSTNFQGISLALSPANEAEAKRLFDALAEGGQVQMPLGKTFFSPAFGMVADRFGVAWMVVAPQ